MLIERDLAPTLAAAARSWPAVTLTGPRQSGKTTLCMQAFGDHPHVSLEAPDVRAFAVDDPRGFLAQFENGAVIDEVQRVPELLSYLQGAIDADPTPGRWILTGSHNLALLQSVSQSLAGRTAVLHLLPLSRSESTRFADCPGSLDETLLVGGYPAILDRGFEPSDWLAAYMATYLERDVRTITNVGDLNTFNRFVQLCAGRSGQLLNYSALAGDCGISQPTAKAWLSVLEASYIVFRLDAFATNTRKRLVRMPKLHFYDSGLACWLLGIREPGQLHSHPLRGALFETWVASEIVKHRANRGRRGGVSHYRDRSGTEVDIVVERTEGTTARMALVEARATATPNSRLLDGPRRVRAYLADSHEDISAVAVYGGAETQHRSDGSLVAWDKLHLSPRLAPT
ncbi:MAG: ATP-binding protein [Acidimicrobiaceae bacterium]|nr:ATP-binding protein [Acidimicrobiaceae bacterium]